MPPIPVYANAPLVPQGATPQTAAADEKQALPPTRIVDAKPTSTFQPSTYPPPPQPGARPAAPTAKPDPFFSELPAAPQPANHPAPEVLSKPIITETHTTTITSQGSPAVPPAQFSVPAPVTGQMAGSKSTIYDAGSTFRLAPASSGNSPLPPSASPYESGGVGAGQERRGSLQHPPNYVQNPYAADGTAEDRARFHAAEEQHKQDEGVLGSVKGFLGTVGEGLKKAEEEVWKAVNGKQ